MDLGSYLRFLLALMFVLGLIGLLAVAARRYGLGLPQAMIRGAKGRRLGLVEIMALDPKRKLVLLRRDDVEHLVILGPGGETLIETQIPAPAASSDAFKSALSDATQLAEDRA